MSSMHMEHLTLGVKVEQWPRVTPVRITGYTWNVVNVVVVTLEKDGCVGRGEAGGVYYKSDTADVIARQIESLRASIEAGVSREWLQHMLPPGGARNALDCALWDLEAKLTGRAAWQVAGLQAPHPILTAFTCHADEPERMAARARGYRNARAIKLKLTGEPIDADRVRAVREALPDVWLAIDANQGFTRRGLEQFLPALVESRVALIEQPLRIGEESLLEGFQSPIPIAADESVQGMADLPALIGRFDMANIKLDKCGGLTEGLAMAYAARDMGLRTMIGNMGGTSLAIAPAFLIGQICDGVADLDGPVFLEADRPVHASYADGMIACPREVWG